MFLLSLLILIAGGLACTTKVDSKTRGNTFRFEVEDLSGTKYLANDIIEVPPIDKNGKDGFTRFWNLGWLDPAVKGGFIFQNGNLQLRLQFPDVGLLERNSQGWTVSIAGTEWSETMQLKGGNENRLLVLFKNMLNGDRTVLPLAKLRSIRKVSRCYPFEVSCGGRDSSEVHATFKVSSSTGHVLPGTVLLAGTQNTGWHQKLRFIQPEASTVSDFFRLSKFQTTGTANKWRARFEGHSGTDPVTLDQDVADGLLRILPLVYYDKEEVRVQDYSADGWNMKPTEFQPVEVFSFTDFLLPVSEIKLVEAVKQ